MRLNTIASLLAAALGAVLVLPHAATASSAPSDEYVMETRSGEWAVWSTANPMTDVRDCFAALASRPGVQALPDFLYIHVPGGLTAYKYRLDDQPVTPLQRASEIERDTELVAFQGEALSRVQQAKRLRIEVLPVTGHLQFIDIPLDGLVGALGYIKRHCPQ